MDRSITTDSEIYAFIGTDLNIAIEGFVGLSGNFSFFTVDDEIVAVGSAVTASLSAGDSIYARLEGADFGLVMGNGELDSKSPVAASLFQWDHSLMSPPTR